MLECYALLGLEVEVGEDGVRFDVRCRFFVEQASVDRISIGRIVCDSVRRTVPVLA